MVYFISIFFPFIGLFIVKKPMSAYFCLLFHILILLGASMYPTPLIVFPLWFVLILWSFFEINDYHTRRSVRRLSKKLSNKGYDTISADYSRSYGSGGEKREYLSRNSRDNLIGLGGPDQNDSRSTSFFNMLGVGNQGRNNTRNNARLPSIPRDGSFGMKGQNSRFGNNNPGQRSRNNRY